MKRNGWSDGVSKGPWALDHPPRRPDGSFGSQGLAVGMRSLVMALLVALAAAVVYYLLLRPVPETPPSSFQQRLPATSKETVDYDSLREGRDEKLMARMQERKANYGLKDSVDMVVTSEENVKIGGVVVSMKDVVEKIRLRKGELLEEDLGEDASGSARRRIESIGQRQSEILEQTLRVDPGQSPEQAVGRVGPLLAQVLREELESSPELAGSGVVHRIQEQQERALEEEVRTAWRELPRKILEGLRDRQDRLVQDQLAGDPQAPPGDVIEAVGDRQESIGKERFGIAARIGRMQTEAYKGQTDAVTRKMTEELIVRVRKRLADVLRRELGAGASRSDGPSDIGVYVVKEGDNLWNIHFRFLKEYFEGKGVVLSPLADEPGTDGRSSGVGRILKFSEKMAYIYNVLLQRLSTDIDMIHPLSKIVVYRMSEVFDLLDAIDHDRVDRIQFDGENLWLPAREPNGLSGSGLPGDPREQDRKKEMPGQP